MIKTRTLLVTVSADEFTQMHYTRFTYQTLDDLIRWLSQYTNII